MRTVLSAAAALILAPLVLPFVLLALPFALMARLNARIARMLEPRAVTWNQLIDFEAVIGWKPKPGLRTRALDFHGDAFSLQTDTAGWRGRTRVEDADVVVFGDSFAFGYAVDERAFFANITSAPRIKAVGAPGYNMVQSLLWMERFGPMLTGRTVVWLLYPGNDLEDNLRPEMQGYRMPFLRSVAGGEWQIMHEHVRAEPWPFPSRRTNYESFVEICIGGHLAERAFSACEWLLARAHRLCRAVDAHLIVMTVPDLSALQRRLHAEVLAQRGVPTGLDESVVDRRITELTASLGVPSVHLRMHLGPEHYLTNDVHWNRAGHRRVAEVIEQLASERAAKAVSMGPFSAGCRNVPAPA